MRPHVGSITARQILLSGSLLLGSFRGRHDTSVRARRLLGCFGVASVGERHPVAREGCLPQASRSPTLSLGVDGSQVLAGHGLPPHWLVVLRSAALVST